MTCPQLDAPIVLAHGLFGYDRIGLGRLTFTSYFRGMPEFLRRGGNQVVATRVPPIAGVKLRALVLAEQIERACPGQAVHIIGHSMGGLDARQLLVNPAWSGRILSLTTIGTPHLGSALADLSRLRVGRVYRLLRAMRIKHHGFFDLTRRAAGAVNRAGFAASGVPCFCVAGDPTIELVCWPLKPFYDLLADLEGPNDGLVSVHSALGFGAPLPSWPVDHLRQLNWLTPSSGPSSASEIRHKYTSLVENLARLGFAAKEPREVSEPPHREPDRPSRRTARGLLLDSILHSLRNRSANGQSRRLHDAIEKDGPPTRVNQTVDGR